MRRQQRPAVVVVNDDQNIVDIVCEALKDEGFTTMGVTRAADAFWHIQCSQPHLVILDVHMPEVDGLAVLEQIRADPHTAALPVLFLTAYSDLVRHRRADYRARGAELLPKPFQIDTLIAIVKRILGRCPTTQGCGMRRKPKDAIQALQQRLEARFPTLEWRVALDRTSVPAGTMVSILARKAPGRPAVRIERRVEELETGVALRTLVEGIGEEIMRNLRAVDPG